MPSSSDPANDWKYSREILRTIMREWFADLTALERLAVLFVYDRTFGWGRTWERITVKQFSEGVWSEKGGEVTCYATPFTRSQARARETINTLVERGVLLREDAPPVPRSKKYAINVDWKPEMRLPKRLSDPTFSGLIVRPEKVESVRPKKGGKEEEIEEEANASHKTVDAERAHSPSGKKFEIEKRTVAVRARSRSKARDAEKAGRFLRDGSGFHPTKAAFAIIWKRYWREVFPDSPLTPVPALTVTILWNYWKAWTEERDSGEFADYLRWLFENWNAIRVGSLGWMTDCPKVPEARMIVSAKLRGYFEEAYRQREALAIWRKLEPHERKMKQLVEEHGMDPDKAKDIIEREFATTAEVKRLRQAEERMRMQAHLLERSEKAKAKTQATRERSRPLDPKGWDERKK